MSASYKEPYDARLIDCRGRDVHVGDVLQCKNYPDFVLRILEIWGATVIVKRLDLGLDTRFVFLHQSITNVWYKVL